MCPRWQRRENRGCAGSDSHNPQSHGLPTSPLPRQGVEHRSAKQVVSTKDQASHHVYWGANVASQYSAYSTSWFCEIGLGLYYSTRPSPDDQSFTPSSAFSTLHSINWEGAQLTTPLQANTDKAIGKASQLVIPLLCYTCKGFSEFVTTNLGAPRSAG